MRLSGRDLLGRKVLIIGEVGAGKTRLTASLLEELLRLVGAAEVTVIDMAPPRFAGAGGRLRDYLSAEGLRYLEPERVVPPRLAGRTAEEVLAHARANYEALRPLVLAYLQRPTKVLVVNDLSIYLHAGPLEDVLSCARAAETFLANSYYGESLANDKGSGVSERERRLVEELAKHMDLVLRVPPPPGGPPALKVPSEGKGGGLFPNVGGGA